MWFSKNNFKHILSDEQAESVAKIVNDTLDDNGILLYGSIYDDEGKEVYHSFTNTQDKNDRHYVATIYVGEIGVFDVINKRLKKEKPEDSQLREITAQRNELLERENKVLRGNKP